MRHLRLLFAFTAAAALAACGGGGGDAAPAPTSTPTPAPPAPVPAPPSSTPVPAPPPPAVGTNGTLQTSVPPANYADARRRAAFAELNAARLGAGAGLVAQSAPLDTSASDHAAYLTTNGFASASSPHDATAVGSTLDGVWAGPSLGARGRCALSRRVFVVAATTGGLTTRRVSGLVDGQTALFEVRGPWLSLAAGVGATF